MIQRARWTLWCEKSSLKLIHLRTVHSSGMLREAREQRNRTWGRRRRVSQADPGSAEAEQCWELGIQLCVLRNLATVAKHKHSSKAVPVSRISSVSKWNSCWHYLSLVLYFASREMWQVYFLKKIFTTSRAWQSLRQTWCELPTPWLQACWGRDWSKHQIFPGLTDKLSMGTKQRQNLSQTPCQRTPCSQRHLEEEIFCKLQFSRVVLGVYLLNSGSWGWGGRSPQAKCAKRASRAGHCMLVSPLSSCGCSCWMDSGAIRFPLSHAFQGERKGHKLFFSPSFSAECDLQITLERKISYWFSLSVFVSGAFYSALQCSMVCFSQLLTL